MKKIIFTLTVALLSVTLAFAEGDLENSIDIVDVAMSNGNFTTLLAAVEAAGLEGTLRSDGPFTVFAPTDDAFAKLPDGTVEALLSDVPTLTQILLYHVVPGRVVAQDVTGISSADTAAGIPVVVKTDSMGVMVNDANVILTDVFASNGVIHAIDSVILPPSSDIVEVAVNNGAFNTLVAAVQASGLVETLKSAGPFTVFAPTDDAFAKLPAGTVEALLNDIPTLQKILLYHVVPGRVMARSVVGIDSAETAAGIALNVSVSSGKVMINDSQVILTDILALNGVIHVVDSVIIPDMAN